MEIDRFLGHREWSTRLPPDGDDVGFPSMTPSDAPTTTSPRPLGILGGVSWKFGSQVLGFVLTLLTAGIVPRHLGAFAYGLYALALFLPGQVVQIFECRIRSHFVARIAQGTNPTDPLVVGGFFGLVGTLVGGAFVLLVHSEVGESVFGRIHPVAPGLLAILSVVAILSWWQEFLGGILDGLQRTVVLEVSRIALRSLFTLMIVLLAWSDALTLESLATGSILLHGCSTLFLGLLAWRALAGNGSLRWFPAQTIRNSILYYGRYAQPMLGYLLVGVLSDVAGRLILQSQGGSVQQGHYAFASALAVGTGIAYSAAIPLIIREMGKVGGDPSALLAGVYRYQPFLVAVTLIPVGFILPFMDCIVKVLAGPGFDQAILPARLQMVRPITDAVFGMVACVVYASGRGGLFLRGALVVQPIGLVVLLAFMEWFEPSVALSLKMVFGDILAGVVGTFLLVSWLRPDPVRLLWNAIPPFAFLGAGILLRFGLLEIGFEGGWLTLLGGGGLYLVASLTLGFLIPRTIGFRSRIELQEFLSMHNVLRSWSFRGSDT